MAVCVSTSVSKLDSICEAVSGVGACIWEEAVKGVCDPVQPQVWGNLAERFAKNAKEHMYDALSDNEYNYIKEGICRFYKDVVPERFEQGGYSNCTSPMYVLKKIAPLSLRCLSEEEKASVIDKLADITSISDLKGGDNVG